MLVDTYRVISHGVSGTIGSGVGGSSALITWSTDDIITSFPILVPSTTLPLLSLVLIDLAND